jgi:hypothetical protein
MHRVRQVGPHTFASVCTTKDEDVFRESTVVLPLYQLDRSTGFRPRRSHEFAVPPPDGLSHLKVPPKAGSSRRSGGFV